MTLEVWSNIDGEVEDAFLPEVGAAVEGLQRGEWPLWPTHDEHARTYRLRWLGVDESRQASLAAFGLDLDSERLRRRRTD